MKLLLSTAALALSSASLLAQAGERGISHPDSTPITVDNDEAAAPREVLQPAVRPKPSAYVPYTTPAAVAVGQAAVPDPDAGIVTTTVSPAGRGEDSTYRPYTGGGLKTRTPQPESEVDPDSQIVTEVPLRAGEMPEGTLLKVRITAALSTQTSALGAPFSAIVEEDVKREERVIIPAGSTLEGTVTEVHGGRRIAGRAAMHLEPRRVTLPDGTFYTIHAQVIDTGEDQSVRVDNEGTIVRRDHAVETIAILGATTGTAAIAGALIGGGVGAAVGAGIGAGAGTILWLKQDRQAALPKNTALIFSLTTPMILRPLSDR